VEAARALVADAADGQLFTTGLLYMAHVDAYDPYDPAETTALRLSARNRALLCVKYAGALRAEELSTARVQDLEPLGSGYRLRLPSTKTSRDGASQAVVLDSAAGPLDPVGAVDRWLAVRGDGDGPLFGTVHHSLDTDRGMTPDELRGVLQDLAVQVGLPPTVSVHSLRRSWATHAYLRDPDSLGEISLHLRHARIINTARYIEDLTTHLLDREQLLSSAVMIAGPGGQAAPARNLGFDRAPLDELVGVALQSSGPGWPFAPSTLAGYASHWSTWERWATEHRFASFPADPRHVALFAVRRQDEDVRDVSECDSVGDGQSEAHQAAVVLQVGADHAPGPRNLLDHLCPSAPARLVRLGGQEGPDHVDVDPARVVVDVVARRHQCRHGVQPAGPASRYGPRRKVTREGCSRCGRRAGTAGVES